MCWLITKKLSLVLSWWFVLERRQSFFFLRNHYYCETELTALLLFLSTPLPLASASRPVPFLSCSTSPSVLLRPCVVACAAEVSHPSPRWKMKVALYLGGIFHCEPTSESMASDLLCLLFRTCGGDFVKAYLQILAHLCSVFLEAGMSHSQTHQLCSENFRRKTTSAKCPQFESHPKTMTSLLI